MPAFKFPTENAERRILGHLPAWRSEKGHAQAQRLEAGGDKRKGIAGCGFYVRHYTVSELLARLRRDEQLPLDLAVRTIARGDQPVPLNEDSVRSELHALKDRGLADCDEQGRWTMTEAGLHALTDEEPPC